MSDTAELTDGEKALSAPIGLPDIPLAFYIRDVERIVAQRERAAFTAGRATAYTEIADELAKPHWSSWVETPLIRSWLRARATDLRAAVAPVEGDNG